LNDYKIDKFQELSENEEEISKVNNNMNDGEEDEDVED